MKNPFLAIVYLVIGLAFFILWKNQVDIRQSFMMMQEANTYLILGALVVGIVTSVVTNMRLKTLFMTIKADIPLMYLISAGYSTFLVSSIIPFYSGGFSLAYLISQRLKVKYRRVLSVLILELLLGIGINYLICLIALFYFDLEYLFLAAVPLGIVGAVALLPYRKTVKDNFKLVLKAVLFSILSTFLSLTQLVMIFNAFGLNPNVDRLYLTQSLFNLINLIPGIPFKIGQFEASGILTYSGILKLDALTVSSAVLSLHIISILIGVLGALVLIKYLKNGKK